MVGKDLIMATLLGSGGGSGSGGGGSAGVSPKEVNFYDYDGTCVHAYTVEEAQALSELPAGPEHPGLVFQGWNWSLEGVKGLTRAMNIGAMYTTDDGTTRLYITLHEGRTSPMLGVGVNGTVTVDWGDGTEPDVLTGTSVSATKWTPNHAYAASGDYVIRLTVDGEMAFTGDSSGYAHIMRNASVSDKINYAYQRSLRKVEIGENVTTISKFAFNECYNLDAVVTHKGVELPDGYGMQRSGIHAFVIPSGCDNIGNYCFNSTPRLRVVSLPEGTTYGQDTFDGSAVQTLIDVLPLYKVCYQSGKLVAATISENAASIEDSAFYQCYALSTPLFIPPSVASVGTYAFYQCYSLSYIDFTQHTAVPALSNTNAFQGCPSDCKVRVPAALYDEWIAATNWSTMPGRIEAY